MGSALHIKRRAAWNFARSHGATCREPDHPVANVVVEVSYV
jgi:hypothetical protein